MPAEIMPARSRAKSVETVSAVRRKAAIMIVTYDGLRLVRADVTCKRNRWHGYRPVDKVLG